MTAAAETLTTELSVDCKDGVLQIDQMEARLGTVAQAAAAASKVNREFSRSTGEAGAETEKTTAKLRVYENQTKALEARIASFTARHDPLSKARRDLANAEDLYAKAARRGLEVGENQLRAMDNLRARVNQLAVANDNAARSAQAVAKAQSEAAQAVDRAALNIHAAAVRGKTDLAELSAAITELTAARAKLAAPVQIAVARATGLDRSANAANAASRGDDIAAWAKELDRLQARFDPVFAAQQRYETAVAELRDAHAKGAVDAAAYGRALAEIEANFNPATAAARANGTALEGLRLQFDEGHAAQALFAAEQQKVIDLFIAGGINARQLETYLAKVAQAYDPAVRASKEAAEAAEREAAARQKVIAAAKAQQAADMDAVQQKYDPEYAEVARYVTEMDRVTAILDAANASEKQRATVLRGVAEAYDPAIAKSREEAAALEREAAARQKVIAAAKAHQAAEDAQGRYNQVLGIRPAAAGSAAASASVFLEAEENAKALETLRRRYDATHAAEARHREEVEHVIAVTRAANATDEERAALLAKVEAAHKTGATGVRLQAHELTNLSYQIQDVAVQLAGGQSPFLIMMQQGPQAAMAVGGFGRALELLKSPLVLTGAAVVGLAVGIGLLVKAQEDYAGALRETARVNSLTGGSSGMSNAALEAQAEAAAKAAHISVAAARDIQNAYVATGRIGGRVLGELTAMTRDYAVKTAQDTDKAAQELAGMFVDPGRAAEEAARRWNVFDEAQIRVIKNLQAQGRLEEAQLRLLDGMSGRFADAAKDVSMYAEAWHEVETAVSDAWNALGKGLSGTGSIADLKARWTELQGMKGKPSLEFGYFGPKQSDIDAAGRDYGAAFRNADADEWFARKDKGGVDFKALQSRAMDFVRGLTPAIALAHDYANAQELMNRAVAAGAVPADQAKQALAAYSRQVEETVNPTRSMVAAIEQETQALTLQAGAARNAWTALQQLQNRQPGREIGFDQASGVQTAVKDRAAAQSDDRVRTLKAVTQAEKDLAKAQAGLNPAAIAKATVDLAVAQREANGETVSAAEKTLLQGQASTQLAGQLDAAAAGLKIATEQQWFYTLAAGQGEAMQRKARIEAEVLAAGYRGLGQATRDALEAQEELVSVAIHSEFAGQIDQEVAANQRLAAAMGQGVAAYRDAEIYNKALAQALKETPPQYDEAGKATGRFSEAIAANVAKLKEQQGAADAVDLSKYIQAQENVRKDLNFRGSVAGMSEDAKAVAKAHYDTIESLRRQGIEYDKLDAGQQRQFENVVKLAEENAKIETGVKRQEDAWNQVGQIGARAFDRIGDAVTQIFLEGKKGAISWGSLMKSVASSVVADLAKMGANDLKRMVGLGGSGGGLMDLFGGGQSQAQPQVITWNQGGQTIIPAQNQGGFSLNGLGNLFGGGASGAGSSIWGNSGSLSGYLFGNAGDPMMTGLSNSGLIGSGGGIGGIPMGQIAGGIGGAIGLFSAFQSFKSGNVIGGIGSAIGGGLGLLSAFARAAFAALGPLGPIAMVAAPLIGSLFGKARKGDIPAAAGEGYWYASTQKYADGKATTDNGGDMSAAQQMTAAIKAFGDGAIKIGGVLKTDLGWLIEAKKGRYQTNQNGNYGSLDEAVIALLRGDVAAGKIVYDNADVNKAVTNSKATKAEDFMADLQTAKDFALTFDRLRQGVSATAPALEAMRQQAETLGKTAADQLVTWRDKVVELGLSTTTVLNPLLRAAAREMAGLGSAAEPLVGVTAAVEQVKLNFEALKPTLTAIGMTADQQAGLLAEMTAKARSDYAEGAALTQRYGAAALAQARGDATARVSYDDLWRTSGLRREIVDVENSPVDAGVSRRVMVADPIIAVMEQLRRSANGGMRDMTAYAEAVDLANRYLDEGVYTQDQYKQVIAAINEEAQRAVGIEDARRAGGVAIETAINAGYRPGVDAQLSALHMTAPAIDALRPTFTALEDAAAGGTASADQLRAAWTALQGQLAGGALTADQATQAVSLLTDAYARSQAAARADLELTQRRAEAWAAAGHGPASAAEATARSAQRAAELAAATDNATKARLREIYALEDEARALETARATRDRNADFLARRQTALGDSTGATLTRFDLDAAHQIEAAAAAGQDVGALRGLLAAERAQAAFDAAQQTYLTQIDREIRARQESTEALQQSALRVAEIASAFKDASAALKLSDKSDLTPEQRLAEVRRQFEAAVSDYRAANDNDARAAAAQKIQDLGNQRVEIGYGYYNTTDYSDYRRVLAIFDEFAIANDSRASTAEATIRQNDQVIAQLTEQRRAAERIGERQLGSLDGLLGAMNAAKATLDAQLAQLAATPAPVVNVTVNGQTTTTTGTSPAPVLTAAQQYYAAYADVAAVGVDAAQHYAQYGAREGRQRFGLTLTQDQEYLARYADVAAAVAAGTFRDGREHYEMWGRAEGRRYADGGLVTGGTPGVDSVRAWLMPGERVLSVPHSAMLERIYAMAAMAPPPVNDALPPRVVALQPPPAVQPSPPELAELVKLLRELIALIGAAQSKALAQSGAIGGATLAKLEELIREIEEQTYQAKKAG